MTPAARVTWARAALIPHARPAKAPEMAAYLKTDEPMLGVAAADRRVVGKALLKAAPLADAVDYRATIEALWAEPEREFRYLAVQLAHGAKAHVTVAHLPFYRELVVRAAWWDLVDELAAHVISPLRRRDRARVTPVMDAWLKDDCLWVRRVAVLSQLKHKAETDAAWLFAACLDRAHEPDFFIRKAIGWALRDYSWAAPEPVQAFLARHGDALSGLSRREAGKRLRALGRVG
ncbi:MAG: DNA alkylation repair protein [Myxococcales bacterium]|nr:DNA alkylation repair protein [Myxococcales bacterium]MCB9522633.1 DNA alkylation repair protein [Myxococcales bacterium]